jgi:hypothetical protein
MHLVLCIFAVSLKDKLEVAHEMDLFTIPTMSLEKQ